MSRAQNARPQLRDPATGGRILGRRTRYSHPYSYDPIVTLEARGKATAAVYTDRLWQWDHEKYDRCRKAIFGDVSQFWTHDSPENIGQFLRLYYDDDSIEVLRIEEHCNPSNGYPVWRFDYASRPAPEER